MQHSCHQDNCVHTKGSTTQVGPFGVLREVSMEAGLLTGPEVAKLCRVQPPTVRSWKQRGLLPVAGVDGLGRNLYRQLDAARVEAATRKKAGRKLPGLAA